MNLTIKTVELQEMVTKAIKCTSNNKLIPLTSLMSVKVESNILTITTTDATNYFYVRKKDVVDCEDFEVSVMADLFTHLIQKTTSDNITLSVEGGVMKVTGNGTYTMELPLDENGSVIKFPKKVTSEFRDDAGVIKLSTIQTLIKYNKPSLAVNMELPVLTNYYCGDKVLTSDKYKICSTDIKMFEKPMLISSPLMELLSSVSDEDIQVVIGEGYVIYSTSVDTIYAPIAEGVDGYPVKPIMDLVNSEFASNCKVSKQAVLNLIDRLSLFVTPYDKKGIYLTFTKDGIMFSSKKSSGEELIPYVSSDNFKDYTCCIDIEMLKSQVATQEEELLDLSYGSEIAIKLKSKNIIQIVALMEDDRLGA